jgi:DNA (cytosine-5)-methyltransferase 1
MRHGSLFSGIGGFDLAAEWMGWENVFHCEWNEFGQKILKHYWPKAISYGDITKTDFTIHRGGIDLLTGGFPCQPYSMVGKRKGKEDERHLWPEMLRAVGEIQPPWVVGENVPGIVNWSGGLVFHEVQTDLEAKGYEVFPIILPACSVNAPHKRERIWFIAHALNSGYRDNRGKSGEENGLSGISGKALHSGMSDGTDSRITPNSSSMGWEQRTTFRGEVSEKVGRSQSDFGDFTQTTIGNSNGIGLEGGMYKNGRQRDIPKLNAETSDALDGRRTAWDDFPTQPPLCGRDDGFSSKLDGITFSKHRVESVKAYGNAIVPQVAYQIFKAIEETNNKMQ